MISQYHRGMLGPKHKWVNMCSNVQKSQSGQTFLNSNRTLETSSLKFNTVHPWGLISSLLIFSVYVIHVCSKTHSFFLFLRARTISSGSFHKMISEANPQNDVFHRYCNIASFTTKLVYSTWGKDGIQKNCLHGSLETTLNKKMKRRTDSVDTHSIIKTTWMHRV